MCVSLSVLPSLSALPLHLVQEWAVPLSGVRHSFCRNLAYFTYTAQTHLVLIIGYLDPLLFGNLLSVPRISLCFSFSWETFVVFEHENLILLTVFLLFLSLHRKSSSRLMNLAVHLRHIIQTVCFYYE